MSQPVTPPVHAKTDPEAVKNEAREATERRRAAREASASAEVAAPLPTVSPSPASPMTVVSEPTEVSESGLVTEPATAPTTESALSQLPQWSEQVLWSILDGRIRLRRINGILYLSIHLTPQG